MNARLCFLPFFDDYSIRPLEVDKRISILKRCPITSLAGKYNLSFFVPKSRLIRLNFFNVK